MRLLILLTLLPLLGGCGYDALRAGEREVAAAWRELAQRCRERAGLAAALAEAARAGGHHLEGLEPLAAAARIAAAVASDETVPDRAEAFAAFRQAQDSMELSLRRVLGATREAAGLEAQRAALLAAQERVAVARNRYIRAARDYNLLVSGYPASVTAALLGLEQKANFTIGDMPAAPAPPGEYRPEAPQGRVVQPPALIPVPQR